MDKIVNVLSVIILAPVLLSLLALSNHKVYPLSLGQATGFGTGRELKEDASSLLRRRQLNSDIRAREQRSAFTGQVSDADLASKVRNKLEANLQWRQIFVTANEGVVVLRGTVATQRELSEAQRLPYQIHGVRGVVSKLDLAA